MHQAKWFYQLYRKKNMLEIMQIYLAAAVPDTGTTLALLGIGFSGLAFLRTRLK
jgi:hypothetical protein